MTQIINHESDESNELFYCLRQEIREEIFMKKYGGSE